MSIYQRLRSRHMDRCPVLIECSDSKVPRLKKKKLLVPFDLTFGQLMYTVRQQFEMDPSYGIFMMVDGVMVNSGDTIREHDTGSVVVVTLCCEYTFG